MNHSILSKLSFILIPMLLSSVALSCFSLAKTYPDKKTFLITLDSPKTSPTLTKEISSDNTVKPRGSIVLGGNFSSTSVRLRRVRISPKFQDKGFVYRRGEAQFETDFYNEFFITPQTNIQDEVRVWIEKSQVFGEFVDSNSRVPVTHNLDLWIDSLYGDYRTPSSPLSVVKFQFALFKDKEGADSLIFKKDFLVESKLKDNQPEELVLGYNRAISKILEQFTEELKRVNP